ncbi:hypothetical protein MUU72_00710 [Streptomyces sp. RS10V-4]|nr:hypothetical protein [Streptomyces rhizoryzae]
MSAADVSWRVYRTPGLDARHGNYEENALEFFGQFHTFDHDDPRYRNAMTTWDLSAFDAHCKDGTLPTASPGLRPHFRAALPGAGHPRAGAQHFAVAPSRLR